MRLADLLKPEDGRKEILSLRKLVRQKSLKAMVQGLKSKSNPKDEDHREGDVVGDGNRESDTPNDNATKDLM